MQAIYAFGVLILLAFLGSRFIYKGKKSVSPLPFFFFSGFLYILLGLYLGKHGINVISIGVLRGFSPIIGLGLGWIGFLFGFQLEYRYLKRFPKKYMGLSFLQFLFVSFLVFSVMYYMLRAIFPDSPAHLLNGIAVAFALMVSVHSPTNLNVLSPMFPKRGSYFYLARFLVSVGGFWGIVGLVLLSSFWHFPFFESRIILNGFILLLVSTIIPSLLGHLFHLLTAKRTTEQDLLVYLLGLVFFLSGAAFYFNLLPLYVCMVMGITFSNLTRKHEKIYPLLLSTEKPLYLVLLILVGALWEFNFTFEIGILVLLMLGLRICGFVLPLPVFEKILRFPIRLPLSFGFCFLSSGGVGIAVAISLKMAYPVPLTDVFLSVALITFILSEIFTPWGVKESLFKLDLSE